MFSRIAQSVLFFLVVVSLAALAPAQSVPSRQDQSTKTSIIIERQLVRFATPGEIVEWHLVVSNQQGEVVYDSDLVSSNLLEWPLKNQQGEDAASGLYAYTLTTKAPTDEQPRTQHGHLILDCASSQDRVWITSNSDGIGTANDGTTLTVAGAAEASVGGAELPAVPARNVTSGEQAPGERSGAKKNTLAVANISGSGTTNRITKW